MNDSTPYEVPRAPTEIDLRLDANEGPAPEPALMRAIEDVELVRRYRAPRELEAELAARFGLEPEQVIVTAGADDALLRCSLAFLSPERELVVATPAFEMIPRYARQVGAHVRGVPEGAGRFPCAEVVAAVRDVGARLGMVVVVSPSNPTGSVATASELRSVAEAAPPDALVVLDAAYAEFAEEDLTPVALGLPNAVCVRTFSKAWGLAGTRVGFAMGPAELIQRLRMFGSPYAVATPSIALACRALTSQEDAMKRYVERVGLERARLAETLARLGARPRPSQANFVLADVDDPVRLRDGLAALGIGVRVFPSTEGLEQAVRITCPGDRALLDRLERSLAAVMQEEERS